MKSRDWEYSKRKLNAIIWLWFAGAAYGMVFLTVQMILAPESASLDALLTYIGAPMGCGITAYLIKSAWEKRKLNNENQTEEEEHGSSELFEENQQ